MTGKQDLERELKGRTGLNFKVAFADGPTLHDLHQAILSIDNQTPATRLAVFDNGLGMISLVEGPYHFAVWAGLPLMGDKLHTVQWQGAAEYRVINQKIASRI